MAVAEILHGSHEFEQNSIERERTLLALFPDQLQELREQAHTIRQVYLSGLGEPCELRMREIVTDEETYYEVALKGDTAYEDGSRVRDEPVPGTRISKELFDFYADNLPTVHKLRYEPHPRVAVDFYADHVTVETEDALAALRFFDRFPAEWFADITGDHRASNEWLAHLDYRLAHAGKEAFAPTPELETDTMIAEILMARTESLTPLIVTVGGRSGSGKSTIVRELREKLALMGLTSDVTSTDDYHRGKQWLEHYNGGQEWKKWDDEIVYNLRAMQEDLERYRIGEVIPKLHMNFVSQEPEMAGIIRPVDVLIVEGIYASSVEIAPLSSLHYEMPTPLATCVWRRILRDLKERPLFANPAESLLYILSEAEPAYRTQMQKRQAAGL